MAAESPHSRGESSLSKQGKTALAAVLIVVCVASVWRLLTRPGPGGRKPASPELTWKCSQCGEVFEARMGSGPSGGSAPLCPKCRAAARRLIHFHCTQCGHEFDHLIAPSAEGAMAEPLTCPKCKDKRVLPDELFKKR